MANATGVPYIEISMNSVTICGVVIPRPSSIGVSQWLRFWERIVG